MQPHDFQFFTQLAGTAWFMVFLVFLFLGALAVLLPFFVWRIWKWSHATFSEVARLNDQIARLVTLMENSSRPASGKLPSAGAGTAPTEVAEEMFTFSPEEEKPAPATEAAAPTVPEESSFPQEEQEPLPPFGGEEEEGTEWPAEVEGVTPEVALETPFTLEETPAEPETAPSKPGFEEEEAAEAAALVEEEGEEPAGAVAFGGEEETAEAAPFPREEIEEPPSQPQFEEEEEAAAAAAPPQQEPEEPLAPGEEAVEEEVPVTPAEENPAVIPLPDNPRKPDSHLARCGTCGHKLAYKKKLSGKRVRCPACKTPLVLP